MDNSKMDIANENRKWKSQIDIANGNYNNSEHLESSENLF